MYSLDAASGLKSDLVLHQCGLPRFLSKHLPKFCKYSFHILSLSRDEFLAQMVGGLSASEMVVFQVKTIRQASRATQGFKRLT